MGMQTSKEYRRGEALYLKKGKRVWEIDFLRGFCIILMIFDHFMFDIGSLDLWFSNFWQASSEFMQTFYFFAIDYWSSTLRIFVRIIVISIFLFLSGISGVFSRNNISRALKLCMAAIALSCATIALDQIGNFGVTIIFGVLHCLAISVLVYTLLKYALKHRAKYAFLGFGILIMLYAATFNFYYLPYVNEPLSLKDLMGVVLGFKAFGADYFGLIPYLGVFLMGAYCGEVFYANKTSHLPMLDGKWNRPLCFIGRKTLWVYLLHQPAVLAIIIVIGLFLGFTI